MRHLSVHLDGVPVVVDADVELEAGQVLAVLGPSGSGKSTLLRALAGLEQPSAGTVVLDGQDLAGVPTHRRGIALMFQDGQLFGHLDVARNVGYPLRLRHTPAREIGRRVDELLDLVGLPGLGSRGIAGLSGGERQRVALARALAVQPRLLLLDEPLSALDRGLRERLAGDLREILVAAGTTSVLVTHDQEEAFAVADRMTLLRAGRVVQSGSLQQVWAAPADAEAARFLGYAEVLVEASARRMLAAGGEPVPVGHEPVLALRRSALTVSDDGALAGRVVAVRATPDVVRLTVHVDGIGELAAVAPAPAASPATPSPVVGDQVQIMVDLTRTARLMEHGRQTTSP